MHVCTCACVCVRARVCCNHKSLSSVGVLSSACICCNFTPRSLRLSRHSSNLVSAATEFLCTFPLSREREIERGRERAQRRSPTTVIHKITLMKVKCGSRQQSVNPKETQQKIEGSNGISINCQRRKGVQNNKNESALLFYNFFLFSFFNVLLIY